jgi:hypothetical protein
MRVRVEVLMNAKIGVFKGDGVGAKVIAVSVVDGVDRGRVPGWSWGAQEVGKQHGCVGVRAVGVEPVVGGGKRAESSDKAM